MLTITLKAADAVAIASLIATADGKDSPALAQVRLVPNADGVLVAVATNRYVAATYFLGMDAPVDLPVDGIGLSPAACKFIAANVKRVNKWTTREDVEIIANIEARELSVRHGAAVLGDTWPAGKYPVQILGLVDSWQPAPEVAPVRIGQTWLNQLGKLMDGFTKVDSWILELGANAAYVAGDLSRTATRPGPIRAKSGNYIALIQPRVDR